MFSAQHNEPNGIKLLAKHGSDFEMTDTEVRPCSSSHLLY
eukprot:SAG11_NODE_875_length_6768_cov_2.183686_6_plen_40_part_00